MSQDKYYNLWNSDYEYVPQQTETTIKTDTITKNNPIIQNNKKKCGSCNLLISVERFPVHQKNLQFGWCKNCCLTNISEPPLSNYDSLHYELPPMNHQNDYCDNYNNNEDFEDCEDE